MVREGETVAEFAMQVLVVVAVAVAGSVQLKRALVAWQQVK